MQKKLLTVAVASALAAPAAALAQVEVYGFVNMSLGMVKYTTGTNPVTAPSISKWDVASHASNYGVRSRESLGGGLTGWMQIETNAPMERSSNVAITPASRNSAVGLQGGFGNIFIGQWTTPWADLDSLWSVGTVGGWGPVTSIIGRRETTGQAPNPNCDNPIVAPGVSAAGGTVICNAVEAGGGVGHPFWKRISNSVFYQSPVMAGVQAKFAAQAPEGKATAGATRPIANPWMWSASVQWAGMGGRARVGAAYDNHKEFTVVNKSDTGYRVTGGFNFGVVDLGAAFEAMKYAQAVGDIKARQWGLAVAVPIGAGAVRASYASAKDLTGPGAAVDTGAKTYNAGYDHRFSKRTTVGAGYAKIDNKAGAVFAWTGLPPTSNGVTNGPLPGQDVQTFFVNMIHRF
jgi:predicted porin